MPCRVSLVPSDKLFVANKLKAWRLITAWLIIHTRVMPVDEPECVCHQGKVSRTWAIVSREENSAGECLGSAISGLYLLLGQPARGLSKEGKFLLHRGKVRERWLPEA